MLSLQFLLPLIIEKLDSDVPSAKLDSMETLVRKALLISVIFQGLEVPIIHESDA